MTLQNFWQSIIPKKIYRSNPGKGTGTTLINGEKIVFFIDIGDGIDWRAQQGILDPFFFQGNHPKTIKILSTHFHYDHINGIKDFLEFIDMISRGEKFTIDFYTYLPPMEDRDLLLDANYYSGDFLIERRKREEGYLDGFISDLREDHIVLDNTIYKFIQLYAMRDGTHRPITENDLSFILNQVPNLEEEGGLLLFLKIINCKKRIRILDYIIGKKEERVLNFINQTDDIDHPFIIDTDHIEHVDFVTNIDFRYYDNLLFNEEDIQDQFGFINSVFFGGHSIDHLCFEFLCNEKAPVVYHLGDMFPLDYALNDPIFSGPIQFCDIIERVARGIYTRLGNNREVLLTFSHSHNIGDSITNYFRIENIETFLSNIQIFKENLDHNFLKSFTYRIFNNGDNGDELRRIVIERLDNILFER